MKGKTHDLNHDLKLSAHTINGVCHSIKSMFRVLGIYNFGWRLQNGIMMYEGETEKESRDSLNMVEQMKIMYGAINLAVIHGAPLRSLSGLDQSHFLASQP